MQQGGLSLDALAQVQTSTWVIGLILFAIVAAIALEYRLKRGTYRPPSSKADGMPVARSELGMEATDVEGFRGATERDAVLARATGGQAGPPLIATPGRMADDETYAARYHRAFGATGKDGT